MKSAKTEKAIRLAVSQAEQVMKNRAELKEIMAMLAKRKRGVRVRVCINQNDLMSLRGRAAKLGIKLDRLIPAILHRVAES